MAGLRRIYPCVVAASAACNLTLPYPSETVEAGGLICTDGVDNDLDGLTDCEDDSCGCNRCGDPVVPETDELGRFCSVDCECERGELCNLPIGRCATDPNPEENTFEVDFVQEVERSSTGTWSASTQHRRNVSGRLRFNGASYDLSASMTLSPQEMSFGGSEGSFLRQPLLRFSYSGPPVPKETSSASFFLDDGLAPPMPDGRRSRSADFSFVAGGAGNQRELQVLAIVPGATIEFQPLIEGAPGYWRGRVVGTLREATNYHRARGNACDAGRIYDPESGECAEFRRLESLYIFACLFGPSPAPDSGGFVFLHQQALEGERLDRTGRCSARLVDEEVIIDARGKLAALELEVRHPYVLLATNIRRTLGEEGIEAKVDGIAVVGHLDIEVVREGDDGVIIGWIGGTTEP